MARASARLTALVVAMYGLATGACGGETHASIPIHRDASLDGIGSAGASAGEAGVDTGTPDAASDAAGGDGVSLIKDCPPLDAGAPCSAEIRDCYVHPVACPWHVDMAHCDNGTWWIELFDYPLGMCPAEPFHDGEPCDPCYSWPAFSCAWCVSAGQGQVEQYVASCDNSEGLVPDPAATWTVTTSFDAGACGDAGAPDAAVVDAAPDDAGVDAADGS